MSALRREVAEGRGVGLVPLGSFRLWQGCVISALARTDIEGMSIYRLWTDHYDQLGAGAQVAWTVAAAVGWLRRWRRRRDPEG